MSMTRRHPNAGRSFVSAATAAASAGAIVLTAVLAYRSLAAPASASEPRPAEKAAGEPLALGGSDPSSIVWITDFEQALEEAEILRRPVMVDLWARWCGWCHQLDLKTYAHPEVVRRARSMTCGKVNADQEVAVARRFRIRGLPTIIFLDRHGQEVDRVNGFVEAEPFAQVMDDVRVQADHSEERARELEADPKNPVRIYALADELIAQDKLAEAEPLLERLAPGGSDARSVVEAEAVFDLAVVRAARGDHKAARHLLEDFLEDYPESPRRPEAELRLGQLLAEAGETRDARPHLEAVSASSKGSWKAAEAERLLAVLSAGKGSRAGGKSSGRPGGLSQ